MIFLFYKILAHTLFFTITSKIKTIQVELLAYDYSNSRKNVNYLFQTISNFILV